MKCDFFVWCDISTIRELGVRYRTRLGGVAEAHLGSTFEHGRYMEGKKKFLKRGSSGTMVNIVILREKKNETNMQKAVLDPRKALSAAAQVNRKITQPVLAVDR